MKRESLGADLQHPEAGIEQRRTFTSSQQSGGHPILPVEAPEPSCRSLLWAELKPPRYYLFFCFASSSAKPPRLSCLLGSLVARGILWVGRPVAKETVSECSRRVGSGRRKGLKGSWRWRAERRSELGWGAGHHGAKDLSRAWTGCSLRGCRPLGKGVARPRFCSAVGGLLRSSEMSCPGGASMFA